MESMDMECVGGDNPQGASKKGVKVCKDKRKTNKITQKSFKTKGKYNLPKKGAPKPPEKMEGTTPSGDQSHMNVRYL